MLHKRWDQFLVRKDDLVLDGRTERKLRAFIPVFIEAILSFIDALSVKA
jgi:hypothetical protein